MKNRLKRIFIVFLCVIITPISVYGYANNGYDNSSFYALEPYHKITDKTSKQYKINNSERAYTDSNGCRRLEAEKGRRRDDDPYLVAIGTSHGASVGDKFTATVGGVTRNYVVGDIKANRDTDPTNTWTTHAGQRCIIEYIVDKNALIAAHPEVLGGSNASGNLGTIPGFGGDVEHMNFPGLAKPETAVDDPNTPEDESDDNDDDNNNDSHQPGNYYDTIMKEEGGNGMPSDVARIMFGSGSSYGEYAVRHEGDKGYNHWESFYVEGGPGEYKYASHQNEFAVFYSEMDAATFQGLSNGLRLPSSGLFEDFTADENETEHDIKTDPNTDPGGSPGVHLEKPELNGAGAALDMPKWIKQWEYPDIVICVAYDKNGAVTKTIASKGCLICTVAMAYLYYYGSEGSDVPSILSKLAKMTDSDGNLYTTNALGALGMGQGANVQPNAVHDNKNGRFINGWDSLISNLETGNPVMVHVDGRWDSVTGGGVLHKSANGHWLLATGYDEGGIYVYDPGTNQGGNRLISWEDWAHGAQIMSSRSHGGLYYRCLYPTQNGAKRKFTSTTSTWNWDAINEEKARKAAENDPLLR